MNLLRIVAIALVGLVVTSSVHAQAVLPPPTAGGVAVPPPIETAPPGYVAPGYEALAAPMTPVAPTTPTAPAPGAGELESLLPPMV